VTNKQSMENMRFLFQHKKITIEEFRDYIDSEMLLNPEWASGIYKEYLSKLKDSSSEF